MERATRAPNDFHLRVVVDRLVREGRSQREIEAVVGRLGPPAVPDATAVAAGGRPPARVRVGAGGRMRGPRHSSALVRRDRAVADDEAPASAKESLLRPRRARGAEEPALRVEAPMDGDVPDAEPWKDSPRPHDSPRSSRARRSAARGASVEYPGAAHAGSAARSRDTRSRSGARGGTPAARAVARGGASRRTPGSASRPRPHRTPAPGGRAPARRRAPRAREREPARDVSSRAPCRARRRTPPARRSRGTRWA